MYLCTFLATWVGGAFIIGIAESVYSPTKGLTWALIPLQMSISFIIGKYLSLLHAGSQYALFEVHKKTDAFESGLDKGVFKTSCKSCVPT